MGTRLCFYSFDKTNPDAGINPPGIPRHPTRINDVAPEARWCYDVLEADGEAKLREVVEYIKQECAGLE